MSELLRLPSIHQDAQSIIDETEDIALCELAGVVIEANEQYLEALTTNDPQKKTRAFDILQKAREAQAKEEERITRPVPDEEESFVIFQKEHSLRSDINTFWYGPPLGKGDDGRYE